MERAERLIYFPRWLGIIGMLFFLNGCESEKLSEPTPDAPDQVLSFPDFITPVGKYFDTRIDGIPPIGAESYRLKISGAVDNPASFTLEELGKLEMVNKTLTTECIGNPVNGGLIGTANWRGFKAYDLLVSLGIDEKAATVKYICADGYYTYNTLEELQSSDILGAMFMNDEPIPPLFGFPLRIIFPGYYGVRNPGWIPVSIRQSMDQDYVWIFWEAYIKPQSAGTITMRSKATDMGGDVQPQSDTDFLDGINSWPAIEITVL